MVIKYSLISYYYVMHNTMVKRINMMITSKRKYQWYSWSKYKLDIVTAMQYYHYCFCLYEQLNLQLYGHLIKNITWKDDMNWYMFNLFLYFELCINIKKESMDFTKSYFSLWWKIFNWILFTNNKISPYSWWILCHQ